MSIEPNVTRFAYSLPLSDVPADRDEIEIVDVFRRPNHALADWHPYDTDPRQAGASPVRGTVGSLSQTQPVLQSLRLGTFPA